MTETKKTAAAKPMAKTAAEPKKEEVKAEPAAVKEAPEAEAKEAPKAATKRASAKKTAEKKPAAKKTAARKTTAKAAPAAKAASAKAEVFVQFDDKSYSQDDLVKIAKDVWQYDLNRDLKDFKTVEIYAKPKEGVAYYVINKGKNSVEGSFGI